MQPKAPFRGPRTYVSIPIGLMVGLGLMVGPVFSVGLVFWGGTTVALAGPATAGAPATVSSSGGIESDQAGNQRPGQTGGAQSLGATDQVSSKALADLPPLEKRLIVSDEGFEDLGFATPCDPGLLASVIPGATAEPVTDTAVSPDTKIYEVRFGWEPIFRAESHPATGNIQRLVIWTPNALTSAGITIGQRFEHAARRTRATWSFEPGDEEFAGALIGTLSGASHLHYVFASAAGSSSEEAAPAAAEPPHDWEVKAFVWTAD